MSGYGSGNLLADAFPIKTTPARGGAGAKHRHAGGFGLFLVGVTCGAVAISILCSPVNKGRPDEALLAALRTETGGSFGAVELSQSQKDRLKATAEVVAKQRKNSAVHGMYHRLVDDATLDLHTLDIVGNKIAARAAQQGAVERRAAAAALGGQGAGVGEEQMLKDKLMLLQKRHERLLGEQRQDTLEQPLEQTIQGAVEQPLQGSLEQQPLADSSTHTQTRQEGLLGEPLQGTREQQQPSADSSKHMVQPP